MLRYVILGLAAILVACSETEMAGTESSSTSDQSSFRFEVASDVSQGELDNILAGLSLAESYMAKEFGFQLTSRQKSNWKVKIVATGRGNQESGGGGACCTAYSTSWPSYPRTFIDIRHQHWGGRTSEINSEAAQKRKIVIHEFIHGIQLFWGVRSISGGPMDDLMGEGMAEWMAIDAMQLVGESSHRRARPRMLEAVRYTGAINRSFDQYVSRNAGVWAGHLGYLMVDGLVSIAPTGKEALQTYSVSLARTKSPARSFPIAFGIEYKEFKQRFESWRRAVAAGQTSQTSWAEFTSHFDAK